MQTFLQMEMTLNFAKDGAWQSPLQSRGHYSFSIWIKTLCFIVLLYVFQIVLRILTSLCILKYTLNNVFQIKLLNCIRNYYWIANFKCIAIWMFLHVDHHEGRFRMKKFWRNTPQNCMKKWKLDWIQKQQEHDSELEGVLVWRSIWSSLQLSTSC